MFFSVSSICLDLPLLLNLVVSLQLKPRFCVARALQPSNVEEEAEHRRGGLPDESTESTRPSSNTRHPVTACSPGLCMDDIFGTAVEFHSV